MTSYRGFYSKHATTSFVRNYVLVHVYMSVCWRNCESRCKYSSNCLRPPLQAPRRCIWYATSVHNLSSNVVRHSLTTSATFGYSGAAGTRGQMMGRQHFLEFIMTLQRVALWLANLMRRCGFHSAPHVASGGTIGLVTVKHAPCVTSYVVLKSPFAAWLV